MKVSGRQSALRLTGTDSSHSALTRMYWQGSWCEIPLLHQLAGFLDACGLQKSCTKQKSCIKPRSTLCAPFTSVARRLTVRSPPASIPTWKRLLARGIQRFMSNVRGVEAYTRSRSEKLLSRTQFHQCLWMAIQRWSVASLSRVLSARKSIVPPDRV